MCYYLQFNLKKSQKIMQHGIDHICMFLTSFDFSSRGTVLEF
jgi:hypothetical protein